MNCLLCTLSETQFDINRGKRISGKHPLDVTGVICSSCMQVLVASSQEKIKKAYQVALDKGMLDKAQILATFLEDEEQDVRKTKKSKRNLIREGPLRMVRPSLNEIRTQPAVI